MHARQIMARHLIKLKKKDEKKSPRSYEKARMFTSSFPREIFSSGNSINTDIYWLLKPLAGALTLRNKEIWATTSSLKEIKLLIYQFHTVDVVDANLQVLSESGKMLVALTCAV